MSRRQPPPAPLGTSDEVEQQFYEALQQGDLERLMALWADDDDIVCVHPGGDRVIGPAAIRASFGAIFEAGGGVPVRPESVRRLQQLGCAVHHLVERITIPAESGVQEAFVLATNVYVKSAMGWRLLAHHASPGMPHELPTEGGDAPSTLH